MVDPAQLLRATIARRCGWVVLLAAGACLAVGVAPLSSAHSEPAAAGGAAQGNKQEHRRREGTVLVDVVGSFKFSGDRATFCAADTGACFAGLENLALERVTQVIGDYPEQLQWSVSGTVTEYRGANYLLLSRAILKSKTAAKPAVKRLPAKASTAGGWLFKAR